MQSSIHKLISLASGPLGVQTVGDATLENWGTIGREVVKMLQLKNGFYAYESALLVRPLSDQRVPLGLIEWNAPECWKTGYAEDLSDVLFFAEDAFGVQFCIQGDAICTFDPETGAIASMSHSLSEWAAEVQADYEFRTGYPLARDWQKAQGPLPSGNRLIPKVPFVLGGKYELDNLYCLNDVAGMLFRASIANQLHDLPDGAQLTLKSKDHKGSDA